jgi:hypothetical protein
MQPRGAMHVMDTQQLVVCMCMRVQDDYQGDDGAPKAPTEPQKAAAEEHEPQATQPPPTAIEVQ